jgi:hypothetical protein
MEWARAVGAAASIARRTGYIWEQSGKVKPSPLKPTSPPEINLEDVVAGHASMVDFMHHRFKKRCRQAQTVEVKIRDQVWRELRNEDTGYVPDPP